METLLQVFFAGGLISVCVYILKLVHDIKEKQKEYDLAEYERHKHEILDHNISLPIDKRVEQFNRSTDDSMGTTNKQK